MTQNADVVVVGAGFAGLTAARDLVRLGYDVVVLEGRDRVGGRSSTTTIAGMPVDLGGTFVGPTQDAVLELARELGCETVPTHSRGKNLIKWRGRVRAYRSTIPRLSMLELFDVSRIQWRFERICRRISVAEPWKAAARGQPRRPDAGPVVAVASRRRLDARPDGDHVAGDLGLRTRPGVDAARRALRQGRRRDRTDARRARAARSRTASPAARSRSRCGWPTSSVSASGSTRSSGASSGTPTAPSPSAPTAATSPPRRSSSPSRPLTAAAIDFSPDLPAEYDKLTQHWPQGNLSKAYAAYETPFWRANGCSGEALSDEGPVFITFDVSPGDDGPGILLGFTDPRSFDSLPPAERRERALAGFADLFGDEAWSRSTTSTTVGAQRISRPAGRPPRYRRVPGRPTGRGCASPWTRSSGQAPKPPTNGPASSTAPSGRAVARPPRCTRELSS